ncbi:m7GpppX diphosphatase [Petromyzon marinus]|uniref:m7GpppX diphosphatase n=1 Tax=Petromyzon marinus TaxID=7757 RepID=UPI003F706764
MAAASPSTSSPPEEGNSAAAAADDAAQQQQKKKKRKVVASAGETFTSLRGFKLVRVLNDNPRQKVVFLHAKWSGEAKSGGDGGDGERKDGEEEVEEEEGRDAVVILEKTPFRESQLPGLLSVDTELQGDLQNDIYGTYTARPPPGSSEMKATVICPATPLHLLKYTHREAFLIEETASDYRSTTLPFLQTSNFSLQWVYNILDKKAEVERVVFEDPDPETGFVLLPDLKWDQKQTNELYLIAICHKRGLKSLRDLTGEHLPLLQNILTKTQAAVLDRYGLAACRLRCYLHYQPSYYHLHVHVTHVGSEAPGGGVERAHLLGHVLRALAADPQHYALGTLTYALREGDGLLQAFQKAGRIPQ